MLNLKLLDKHEKIAFSFSGGKDSTAVWHMLSSMGVLSYVTVYHNDVGDLLPEMRDVIRYYEERTPNFVRIGTDVEGWIDTNGLPSDLVPFSSHPIGLAVGEAAVRLVSRYECCSANLMWPVYRRIKADGNTLVIRGTKASDKPRLTAYDGDVLDGVEMHYPLQGWSDAQVLAYLREQGARVCRLYDHLKGSPDCATCSAWWSEHRGEYLKKYHPALFEKYAARVRVVVKAIEPVIGTLLPEMRAIQTGEVENG